MMSFDDAGSGGAVLLLHSGVCDRRMWRPQLEALRDTHRVVAPDLRGFGNTPLPGEEFAYADDVAGLLDQLGVDQTVLVGSSFGGRVALEVAATRPDRVAGLVLLCPAFGGLPVTEAAEAFGAEEDRLLESGDVAAAVELNVTTWLGPDADDDVRALVREMQARAFDVQLAAEAQVPQPELRAVEVDPARIEVPTLVIGGALDMDRFRDGAAYLADTMPDARLEMLPWAGHLPSLERPGEVTGLIRDFVALAAS